MPTLHLKVSSHPTSERCQLLAVAMTEITARLLGKRAGVTVVTIDTLPTSRWFVGGKPVNRATAMLDIVITEGTNTPDEKAAFIAAVLAELQHQLALAADWEEASYVAVREVPGSDWGYGGVTQAARKLAALHVSEPSPLTSSRLG